MKVSGKSASRAPAPATSATSPSSLSIVASRSNAAGSACTHATLTTPSINSAYERDGVADADLAVAENVRVQPRAVYEGFDCAGLGHGFEVGARLAELDAHALDIADTEPLALELVHVDAAREHVAARRGRFDRDVPLARHGVHRLGRDQRHGPTRRRVSPCPVIAVALEPTSGACLHALDGSRELAVLGGDEDRLDPTFHRRDPTRRIRRRPESRSSPRRPRRGRE